jgi:hypothetical protein
MRVVCLAAAVAMSLSPYAWAQCNTSANMIEAMRCTTPACRSAITERQARCARDQDRQAREKQRARERQEEQLRWAQQETECRRLAQGAQQTQSVQRVPAAPPAAAAAPTVTPAPASGRDAALILERLLAGKASGAGGDANTILDGPHTFFVGCDVAMRLDNNGFLRTFGIREVNLDVGPSLNGAPPKSIFFT